MAGEHADEEGLERFSMGVLTASEGGPIEEHILICQRCLERLEFLDSYHRAMRSAAKLLSPRPHCFQGKEG